MVESVDRRSDVHTPKRRIDIMETKVTEQNELSKDQERCTDHALPRWCDRISRARW
jgi:hypothetical protein